ncbi:carboxylesterase/lipase family protein [Microbacterium sp. GXF0217]
MTDAPVAQTASGPVRGFWRDAGTPNASAAYLGIPFAAAPVGELRFAAPVPPEPWTDVRDATAYGATALRRDPGGTLIPEPPIPGPSVLNVNVFTPMPANPLPVLVWIHGGGYTEGSPASPWYDGSRFNRDGVVTVSLSYRLGFDGFGWIDGAPHNRGVLDWIAGLEWVQQNIAAFGGDPDRVTIGGQSAGGGAVLTLLSMPSAQHLFHSALALSSALADVPLDKAQERGERLAGILGIEPTAEGFRSVPESRILKTQPQAVGGRKGLGLLSGLVEDGLPWGPIVDGEVVTRPAVDALAAGIGADKPLVLGAADDEFTMIADRAPRALRVVPSAALLLPVLRDRGVRRAYLRANRPQRAKGSTAMVGRFVTDHVFRSLVVRVAEARTAADAETWVYAFRWVSPTKGWSCHCLDVPFWFDGLDRERVADLAGPHPPQSLADDMHGAAVSFVTSGAPGWPAWRTEPGTAREFGGEGLPVTTTAYDDTLALL